MTVNVRWVVTANRQWCTSEKPFNFEKMDRRKSGYYSTTSKVETGLCKRSGLLFIKNPGVQLVSRRSVTLS